MAHGHNALQHSWAWSYT